MPRAVVMIRGSPDSALEIDQKLQRLLFDPGFIQKTGCVVETYFRSFGWPDFVAALWGPSLDLIRAAVIEIRERCRHGKNGSICPSTSSIVGVEPTDLHLTSLHIAMLAESGAASKLADGSAENPEIRFGSLSNPLSLAGYIAYMSARTRIMKEIFDKDVAPEVRDRLENFIRDRLKELGSVERLNTK